MHTACVWVGTDTPHPPANPRHARYPRAAVQCTFHRPGTEEKRLRAAAIVQAHLPRRARRHRSIAARSVGVTAHPTTRGNDGPRDCGKEPGSEQHSRPSTGNTRRRQADDTHGMLRSCLDKEIPQHARQLDAGVTRGNRWPIRVVHLSARFEADNMVVVQPVSGYLFANSELCG
jgi:hypothetical protein